MPAAEVASGVGPPAGTPPEDRELWEGFLAVGASGESPDHGAPWLARSAVGAATGTDRVGAAPAPLAPVPGPVHGLCGPLAFEACGASFDPFTAPARSLEDVPSDLPPLLGDWPPCDTALMGRVWGFLQSNLDLVEWALCMAVAADPAADPPPEALACILDRIRLIPVDRNTPVLPFLLMGTDEACGAVRMATGFGRTRICTESGSSWDCGLQMYCPEADPSAPAEPAPPAGLEPTAATRTCAVMTLAASVLHELHHACGIHHPEACGAPYLAGNFFLRGAYALYPEAADTPCCDRAGRVALGSDRSIPGFPPECCTGTHDPSWTDREPPSGGPTPSLPGPVPAFPGPTLPEYSWEVGYLDGTQIDLVSWAGVP